MYAVDAQSKTVDRCVLTRRDVHRARTYVEFSRRWLSYTTSDNALCLIDLETGQWQWTALPAATPEEFLSDWISVTVCLEFSHDGKYLAQQSLLRPRTKTERPNVWSRKRGPQKVVNIWDVASGELVFTARPQPQTNLDYVAFHPQNASLLRLQRFADGLVVDEFWNVATGELIKTLPENAAWDQ